MRIIKYFSNFQIYSKMYVKEFTWWRLRFSGSMEYSTFKKYFSFSHTLAFFKQSTERKYKNIEGWLSGYFTKWTIMQETNILKYLKINSRSRKCEVQDKLPRFSNCPNIPAKLMEVRELGTHSTYMWYCTLIWHSKNLQKITCHTYSCSFESFAN